ncbi:hypothetical protein HBI39_014940 [Parastagonospora nodorum]|nr:hypothetical protein HBI39_014940 [Parastagonospora nodorum]
MHVRWSCRISLRGDTEEGVGLTNMPVDAYILTLACWPSPFDRSSGLDYCLSAGIRLESFEVCKDGTLQDSTAPYKRLWESIRTQNRLVQHTNLGNGRANFIAARPGHQTRSSGSSVVHRSCFSPRLGGRHMSLSLSLCRCQSRSEVSEKCGQDVFGEFDSRHLSEWHGMLQIFHPWLPESKVLTGQRCGGDVVGSPFPIDNPGCHTSLNLKWT